METPSGGNTIVTDLTWWSPGFDEHVPAGDPGGGAHHALVLPGSHHGQGPAAAQEPGGRYP